MELNDMCSIQQVRRDFKRTGVTISGWAQMNGFTTDQVRDVLRGKAKGHYGAAHDIAVRLGIKAGELSRVAPQQEAPAAAFCAPQKKGDAA